MLLKTDLAHLRNTHYELKPIIHWETPKRNLIYRGVIANLVNLNCGNVPVSVLGALIEEE